MLSVIFSSLNGGDDLRDMLETLTRATPPRGGWQLIAVDNASTDGTGDLVRSYADRLPITVLHEPHSGKNRALNRAVEIAEGDLYVFTDDDVLVGKDWLVEWRAVADAQPDFDVFAGRTVAVWPHAVSEQFLKGLQIGVLYAQHEPDLLEGPCDPNFVFGTNMAIRASVFASGVRFSNTIGPSNSPNYAMGSDTEMSRRLHAKGHKTWFASAPLVRHIVPPEHLEPAWILRRGYRWGRGLARMGFPHPCSHEILSRKNMVKAVFYPILLPLLSKDTRLRRQWQFKVDQGYEDGLRDELGRQPRWA
jgi:glycosyltransferase involved in cell wall biosynthesis